MGSFRFSVRVMSRVIVSATVRVRFRYRVRVRNRFCDMDMFIVMFRVMVIFSFMS